MITLFSLLLFWFGFAVTLVGTMVVAIRSTYREAGAIGTLIFFLMSGAVLMGSAGENFSYEPPSALSWPVAIVLWTTFVGSLLITSLKPSITTKLQEETSPPKYLCETHALTVR